MDLKSDSSEPNLESNPHTEAIHQPSHRPSAWPLAIASIMFTIIAIRGFVQYSFVHWKVLATNGQRIGLNLPEAVRAQFWDLLWDLEVIRAISGIGALAFVLLALRGHPRWIAIVATVLSVAGLMSSGVLFYEPIGAYFYEATWRRREARLSVG
jgi:hypothetical protein